VASVSDVAAPFTPPAVLEPFLELDSHVDPEPEQDPAFADSETTSPACSAESPSAVVSAWITSPRFNRIDFNSANVSGPFLTRW
jgi:hypothetical protein